MTGQAERNPGHTYYSNRKHNMRYEYTKIQLDINDLEKLNYLSNLGWRLITIVTEPHCINSPILDHYAFLERKRVL